MAALPSRNTPPPSLSPAGEALVREALIVASLTQVGDAEEGAVCILSQCISHGATLTDIQRLAGQAGWDYARIKEMSNDTGSDCDRLPVLAVLGRRRRPIHPVRDAITARRLASEGPRHLVSRRRQGCASGPRTRRPHASCRVNILPPPPSLCTCGHYRRHHSGGRACNHAYLCGCRSYTGRPAEPGPTDYELACGLVAALDKEELLDQEGEVA